MATENFWRRYCKRAFISSGVRNVVTQVMEQGPQTPVISNSTGVKEYAWKANLYVTVILDLVLLHQVAAGG